MTFNLKFNNKRSKAKVKRNFPMLEYLYISMKARKGLKSHLIKPIVDVITIFSLFFIFFGFLFSEGNKKNLIRVNIILNCYKKVVKGCIVVL